MWLRGLTAAALALAVMADPIEVHDADRGRARRSPFESYSNGMGDMGQWSRGPPNIRQFFVGSNPMDASAGSEEMKEYSKCQGRHRAERVDARIEIERTCRESSQLPLLHRSRVLALAQRRP